MLSLRRLSSSPYQLSRPFLCSFPPSSSAAASNNKDRQAMKLSTLTPFLALVPFVQSFTPNHLQNDVYRIRPRLFATLASSSSTDVGGAVDAHKKGVAAVGTVVAQYNGLTAVKIQDDDSDSGDLLGKEVVLADQRTGIVVVHRPPLVFCYHQTRDENKDDTAPEGEVQILQSLSRVAARAASLVDAYGHPVQEDPTESPGRAIFSPIPQLKDIALINSPVLTGFTMIDALAPIGRGQNMLWITHDTASSRQYLLDWVQALVDKDTPVVYAALDTDDATRAQLPSQVQIVTRALSSASCDPVVRAAEGVAMGGAACALAEQHAMEGKHAVVIVDTLDGHKALWDATTRVLVDVFGIDAVVKSDRDGGASSEMRAFYSSLVQRSAQYKAKRGGGSVTLVLMSTIPPAATEDSDHLFEEQDFATAPDKVKERIEMLVQKKIPLTEANLRKIQIPIPSDAEGRRRMVLQHMEELISMSDGQIWFDEDLQKAGQWPPMDPQRSVTRIGIGADTASRADAPALRKVVEGLRLLLSQARDNLEGVSESNAAVTQKQILRQKALLLVLHQEPESGARRLSESCALLLAASQGLLDSAVKDDSMAVGQEASEELVNGITRHLHDAIPDVMKEIDDTLDLTDESKALMLDALKAHLS